MHSRLARLHLSRKTRLCAFLGFNPPSPDAVRSAGSELLGFQALWGRRYSRALNAYLFCLDSVRCRQRTTHSPCKGHLRRHVWQKSPESGSAKKTKNGNDNALTLDHLKLRAKLSVPEVFLLYYTSVSNMNTSRMFR